MEESVEPYQDGRHQRRHTVYDELEWISVGRALRTRGVTYHCVGGKQKPFKPVPPQFWLLFLGQTIFAHMKDHAFIIIHRPHHTHS